MIICKKCKSDNIVKNGIVRGQQRYQCKACKYTFLLNDRRTNEEVTVLKALNVLIRSLNNVSYTMLEKLLNRDRSLIQRWNQDAGLTGWRSRHKDTFQIDFNQLERYIKMNENLFDTAAPIFVSAGKLLSDYSAILIVQRKGDNK